MSQPDDDRYDSSSDSGLNVVLVDQRTLVRRSLAFFLESRGAFTVRGDFEGGSKGRISEIIDRAGADVAIVGVDAAPEEGWAISRALVRREDRPRVLALSGRSDPVFAERILAAGASGYFLESDPVEELFRAIQTVAAGGVFVSEELRGSLLERGFRLRQPGATHPAAALTDRQLQVFRLLGEGCTTRQIARRLEISAKTVEAHRANIMRTLRIDSAHELLYRAIEWMWFGGSAPAGSRVGGAQEQAGDRSSRRG